MKAIVVEHAGGPEVLQERDWPRPQTRLGWVLIQVKAFGLNPSELYTRLGQSPSVSFPRVLGIECVGTVVEAPGTPLQSGQMVAVVMGGIGRDFDGSYAQYTLVPAEHVLPFTTSLPWEIVGAIPESFIRRMLTASSLLERSLKRIATWKTIAPVARLSYASMSRESEKHAFGARRPK